ncbi:VWA domain-containing protein [Candidatus Poribacteria bacterium]
MISKWRQRWTNSNAFLISLSLHLVVLILIAGYPIGRRLRQGGEPLAVDWVKDVPEPALKRELPKQPIEKKFDPNRELTLKDKDKLSKASPNKIAHVKRKSDRLLERSVEINDADRSDTIPQIMTAAQIRDADSTISGLISTDSGPVDGRGVVSTKVRAAGGGKSGASIMGLDGTGNGLADGGGGTGGLLDRLGIIDFMNEADGPQKVIYCLDVSASMTMGYKLLASTNALKESMMQLSDFDQFNIVTFHGGVNSFEDKPIPASMYNLEKAGKFLDSFTPKTIEKNQGTNILAALRYALNMEPSVIVLITDIQPTQGEVDEERIAEEVRKINTKNTRIYGIGVEVWEPSPTGRLARLLKLLTEQNDGQMRLASSK